MGEPDTKNRGFIGAWRKGRKAFIAGKSPCDNPYKYTPGVADTPYGFHITWIRAFHKYWNDGYESAKEDCMSAQNEERP